eukprot:jgi/Botrbrau1/22654/Bobra.0542s0001.1
MRWHMRTYIKPCMEEHHNGACPYSLLMLQVSSACNSSVCASDMQKGESGLFARRVCY